MNRRTRDSETLGILGIIIITSSFVLCFMGLFKECYAWVGIAFFVMGLILISLGLGLRNKNG